MQLLEYFDRFPDMFYSTSFKVMKMHKVNQVVIVGRLHSNISDY